MEQSSYGAFGYGYADFVAPFSNLKRIIPSSIMEMTYKIQQRGLHVVYEE